MDTKKIKPDYFSTFFMFPFGFDTEGSKISKLFQNSPKWLPQNYEIKKGIDYNEYVYFYKQVRDVLLQMQQHDEKQKEGVKFFKYNFKNHCLKYTVHNPNTIEKPISLKIEEINLHLFEPGVGILIFEIVDDSKDSEPNLSLYDYLAFLTNGRRVFPPFINPESDIENGAFKCGFAENDAINRRECAAQITISCGDDIIIEENYKNNFQLKELGENGAKEVLPYLSKVIRYFLDIEEVFNYDNKHYWPIIDDRMFCHSYYSLKGNPKTINTSFLNKLKIALNSEKPKPFLDDALKIWYQLLFLDLDRPSCVNRPFMLKQIHDSSYNRWSGWGTFYGFTRYSSTTISSYTDAEYLYNHFKTMYYQIAILLFFYRGALLSFSRKSAEIAAEIPDGNSKKERKKLQSAQEKLEDLTKAFLLFRNKLWFREVTAQEQGIEMYDIMTKKMRNIELIEDLQNEIRELYAFFDAKQEKETSKAINILTFLGFIFMPIMIAASLFGMNFPMNVSWRFPFIPITNNYPISYTFFVITVVIFFAVSYILGKFLIKRNISDLFGYRK